MARMHSVLFCATSVLTRIRSTHVAFYTLTPVIHFLLFAYRTSFSLITKYMQIRTLTQNFFFVLSTYNNVRFIPDGAISILVFVSYIIYSKSQEIFLVFVAWRKVLCLLSYVQSLLTDASIRACTYTRVKRKTDEVVLS